MNPNVDLNVIHPTTHELVAGTSNEDEWITYPATEVPVEEASVPAAARGVAWAKKPSKPSGDDSDSDDSRPKPRSIDKDMISHVHDSSDSDDNLNKKRAAV